MSLSSQVAGSRQQGTPHVVTKAKRPGSNRFAKLALHLANIYRLVIKELRSIRSDPIMLVLVAYSFTIAIYAAATGASTEATNLSVGTIGAGRWNLILPSKRPPNNSMIHVGDPQSLSLRRYWLRL